MWPDYRRILDRHQPALAQLLIVAAAFAFANRLAWLLGLGLAAGIGVVAWLANLRRARAILDTPLSRVASAAQGFIKLTGVARPLPGRAVLSPARLLPCVWYRYRRYERRDNKWLLEDSGESEAEFLLDDARDSCLLRPYDAEVHSDRVDTYHEGDIRHVEDTLLAGETIHVLGRFVSQGGDAHFDVRTELDQVLSALKGDQEALTRRYDRNGDGKIDAGEWSEAVAVARMEVSARASGARAAPMLHAIERPRDGNPYLIANYGMEALPRRYRRQAWLYAATAIAALWALAYAPA